MGDTDRKTGLWIEELTTPYYSFVDAGASVEIASIRGGTVPVEPNSQKGVGENTESVERYLKDPVAQRKIASSLGLDQVNWRDFDAVFMPGGHGTMWDLPTSAPLARLLGEAFADGRVVAAVCHGPAGLVDVTLPNGGPLVAGKRVTGFTNTEEDAVGLTSVVPFLLETRLRELGARFEGVADFQPYTVTDGNLVTGQNPASSHGVAQAVLERLNRHRSA
jgi:putative intracellular protease/amidase